MNHFWHGFADMNAVSKNGDFILDRGEGCWLWDENDKKYLDVSGALWYVNVGHGRTAIADAMAAQARKLASYATFGDPATRSTIDLANVVADLVPMPDARIFFTSGGSDSVDTAIKMVRKFWNLKGQPNKHMVISREKGYHGMHVGGTSISGIPDNRVGYEALDEDVATVSWNDADAVVAAFDAIGEDNIAAFIAEPVIGAGGVWIAPENYFRDVRKACAERNILFIADEVITGFGRTGDWFASGRLGIEPDIITMAKGLTSGYAPMGAVAAAPSVWETFYAPGAGMWRHGYTYSGHATAAAAGLANLQIMRDENLPAHVLANENYFAQSLRKLADHEKVAEVRTGIGYLGGIAIADPLEAPAIASRARANGLIVRAIIGGTLQISPPLVMSVEEIDFMCAGLRASLD